jgi:uncharacterized protein YecE (DUF72 family)
VAGKIFVGTSGWNYSHWGNGRFYPRSLPQKEWLAFYARRFGTVELNNTFYRLPPPETFAAWYKRVPASFVFAVKANRFITHIKRLKEPERSVRLFLSHLSRLKKKQGPILFQLPPQMKVDLERLEGLIRYLRRRRRLKVGLEFRHESWLTEEVYDLIQEVGWTICLADGQDFSREIPLIGAFCYIRRHGTRARYASCYSDEQLAEDAGFATKLAKQGKEVYIYFNNDAEGYAVKNALKLIGMLEPTYLARAQKRQFVVRDTTVDTTSVHR